MAAFGLDGCVVTVGGNRITGFGESDAVAYKRASDDWEPVDCCDGATVHNRKLSRRGEVTITLRYDSPAHRQIAALADAATAFSFGVIFPNGRVVESGECRVLKRPEPSFGAKTSDEVWVLSAVNLTVTYEQGA